MNIEYVVIKLCLQMKFKSTSGISPYMMRYCMLCFRKVIQRLPDKGQKTKDFADRISRELELRKIRVDDTVQGFSGLTIDKNEDELSNTLGEIINTGQREKVFINTYERVMCRHEQDPANPLRPANRFHTNRYMHGFCYILKFLSKNLLLR